MGSIFKRPEQEARGKNGKWTVAWVDAEGRRRKQTLYTDKAASERKLAKLEDEARQIRDGLLSRAEVNRREASKIPLSKHIDDYRLSILAKGKTEKHANHVEGAIRRLLADASVTSIDDLAGDRIALALARLKAARSARTANHARGAVKAFARWLALNGRLAEAPASVMALDIFNEKADRKWVRRAFTKVEIDRLLAATEASAPLRLSRRGEKYPERWLSGPERAALYRLTMGTGFRAKELRTLTPERFQLDGPEPSITVTAAYEKSGKGTVQPITRELAEAFRPFLAGKERGRPVLDIPAKTANMLRKDMEAAGIPYKDEDGEVADFHALRASYITHLADSGLNIKIVQALARHSTIVLTMDRYVKVDADKIRKGLEEAMSKP